MAGFEQPLSVETVDIMPTLAGLIGLPLAPGSVDGRCLDILAGPEKQLPQPLIVIPAKAGVALL